MNRIRGLNPDNHLSVPATHAELEARLRPGGWSEAGFLGARESFDALLREDAQTLTTAGVTYLDAAATLEEVVGSALNRTRNDGGSIDPSLDIQPFFKRQRSRSVQWQPLPSTDIGYCVRHWQIFLLQYRGFQACPWGCRIKRDWASIDFIVLNRKTTEYIGGPGLIVHLIQDHHFFEGKKTIYRVDPQRLIRVLELFQKR